MTKLVAATWNRLPANYVQGDYDERLLDLSNALDLTQKIVDQQNYDADGFIKGIFAAPEYLFASPFGGLDRHPDYKGAVRKHRALPRDIHKTIKKRLIELSKLHPRILIVPGTIAWIPTLNHDMLIEACRYYAIQTAIVQGKFDGKGGLEKLLKASWGFGEGEFEACKNDPIMYKELINATLARYARQSTMVRDAKMLNDSGTLRDADTVFGQTAKSMMRNTLYVLLNGEVQYVYDKHANYGETASKALAAPEPFPEMIFLPGINSGMAEIEGVRFGFEICLDHGRNALGLLARKERPKPDIHVIVSDTVAFKPANAFVTDKGFVVHASTMPSRNAVFRQTSESDQAPVIATKKVGGTDLIFWEIEIRSDESYSLAGTFMDPKAKKKPWATG